MADKLFNVNNYVRVRVNEIGMDILRADLKELSQRHPNIERKLLQTDTEGYSRWQLWDLMQTFGPHISMGRRTPFDTTIIVEVSND